MDLQLAEQPDARADQIFGIPTQCHDNFWATMPATDNEDRSRLRADIYAALLALVPTQYKTTPTVILLATRVSSTDFLAVREELGRLETLGVVIEGSPSANSAGPHVSIVGTAAYTWPNFTITEFGARYLQSIKDVGVDLADPDHYVKRAVKYMPTLPPIAMAYLAEASRAYGASLPLASVVLVGIAAEAVLECLYVQLALRNSQFKLKLEQVGRYRTESRYRAFEEFLVSRAADVGDETIESVKKIFRPMRDLIKQTRDESAHHRPVGVNDSRAQSQLMLLLRFAELAAIVEASIGKFSLAL